MNIENSQLNITGEVEYTLLDKNKKTKQHGIVHNLVVSTGVQMVASQLTGSRYNLPSMMQAGIGQTPPLPTNTALEYYLDSADLDSMYPTLTIEGSTAIVEYTCTFGPGKAVGAVSELGIFSPGRLVGEPACMLNRAVCPIINKTADDSLVINWKITFTCPTTPVE